MIVCWFSCGAASACATKLAIEKYGKENVRVVNNPVINEHPDNKRFLADCAKWLGIEIDEQFCEIANKRLLEEDRQQFLF